MKSRAKDEARSEIQYSIEAYQRSFEGEPRRMYIDNKKPAKVKTSKKNKYNDLLSEIVEAPAAAKPHEPMAEKPIMA